MGVLARGRNRISTQDNERHQGQPTFACFIHCLAAVHYRQWMKVRPGKDQLAFFIGIQNGKQYPALPNF